MCWNGYASAGMAAAGFVGAAWSRRKGHEPLRWLPLVYFSLMESLQAVTYAVIGDCGGQANTLLTRLSYFHIAFQPFFINLFGLSWLPRAERNSWKVRWIIWPACVISALLFVVRFALPAWPQACDPAIQPLCGTDTCSYHGEWHIAWRLALSGLDSRYVGYFAVAFGGPLLYRSWRWSLYHFLCGPALMMVLTSDKNERPAIWCLLSIAFLIATHVGPVERWMTVRPRAARAANA